MHSTTSSAQYAYVITDDQNNILSLLRATCRILKVPPQATCRVWGLSYTGSLTAMAVKTATASLSSDCFELSEQLYRSDTFST
ncbi:MAG: hypothetical protein R3B47_09690 [Bacteroidia bacterium]